jgi:3-methyladenine DNA glycosylase AlkD
MSHSAVIEDLNSLADPVKVKGLSGFFKTGPGQYGEGDISLGITVPQQRAVARRHRNLDLLEIEALLHSPIHEHRLTAPIILVEKYQRAGADERSAIYQLYMANTEWINNWDLVDASAEYIVGPELQSRDHAPLLALAHSTKLWERRIAMVACFHYIKQGESTEALKRVGAWSTIRTT